MPVTRTDDLRPRPGFQGSETSGIEAILYPRGNDPVLTRAAERILPVNGRRGFNEDSPSLTQAVVNKQFGNAGSFSLTLKPATLKTAEKLIDQLVDDDWVDLYGFRHGRRWHLMRGTVDEVRLNEQVADSGATSTTITVSGRDFQKCFELTPIWFDRFTGENLLGGITYKILAGQNTGLPANGIVTNILEGMTREFAGRGRSNWEAPDSFPNFNGGFGDNVVYNDVNFRNLDRIAVAANWNLPQGTVWSLAQEWGDLLFNELFCELLPDGLINYDPEQTWDEERTAMTVVIRGKPFPTLATGDASDYFDLPLITVPRESLTGIAIGRGGAERYNAFFVAPRIIQELTGVAGVDANAPLRSDSDIRKHGFRRFDIDTRYLSAQSTLQGLLDNQRTEIRDWYAINPYLYNGTLQAAHGMFNVRLGVRARVPGVAGPQEDLTFYVEGYQHNWSLNSGARTTMTVTRGWRGTDPAYIDALGLIAGEYDTPTLAT